MGSLFHLKAVFLKTILPQEESNFLYSFTQINAVMNLFPNYCNHCSRT